MGKKIRVTESQLKSVVAQRMLIEYGQKGRWKEEWDKEDQILAMFNATFGIEHLGMSKQQLANNIIGTSLASLNQQSSNFDYLRTGEGLDRPHPLQSAVYEEYKKVTLYDFIKIVRGIVEKRLENPPEAVTKKQIGGEIGSKRDEIEKERMDALRKKGIDDPSRFKLISSVPADPVPDEIPSVTKVTSKEEVKDFLTDLIDRITNAESNEDIQKLAHDVEFIKDYIDSEWMDGETENMVAEAQNLYYKKTIPEITRIKQVMGL
ncbi:MAG TPA: hypothetical protein VMX17_09235 [Candidatus Glassbacteria bacterium]|nr:hypothetical protein [Candidatus Glassbacteria bacterium]